jgi:hypothetical protein
MTRRTWRIAIAVFLSVLLGGLGVASAAALWSVSGTVSAQVTTGLWGAADDGVDVVTDGTLPIGLDSRLTYSIPSGSFTYDGATNVSFCHEFKVTNVSRESVTWSVTFDTSKGPYWGLNPTTVKANRTGTLRSFWGGATTGYDSSTGYWTIGGEAHNRELSPGASASVGYCANPVMPPVDSRTFATPRISIDPGSNPYAVSLRVKVTSDSRFQLPWETEVDLADYVCASTLPSKITAENATLTRTSGTRYRLSGTGYYALVGNGHSKDFVFARYNPAGQPFRLNDCP